jgi:hypothetical protein
VISYVSEEHMVVIFRVENIDITATIIDSDNYNNDKA